MYFFGKSFKLMVTVISPPGSFATKIFILCINTEVNNKYKRATLKVLVFFFEDSFQNFSLAFVVIAQ